MDTNARIDYIRQRLLEIEKEKTVLEKELSELISLKSISGFTGTPAFTEPPVTPEQKIELFLKLFRCREDVYPRRWENKKTGKNGYSPVCGNEWRPGVCEKPKTKCAECKSSSYLPLDSEAVRLHLEGREIIGTYAIKEDDTTVFLAADFDDSTWCKDVVNYKKAANDLGIDAAVEISRSGEGAHAWVFFESPVDSSLARRLGTVIMTQALFISGSFNLSSYDRFFPNQDYLPSGGFGNLIALPLQFDPRKINRTVFVNNDIQPYNDQWAYLAGIRRLSKNDLKSILERISESKEQLELTESEESDISFAERDIDPISDSFTESMCNINLEVRYSSMISIDAEKLPAKILSSLRRIATFANPKFFELQRMRFSTWNIPRYICSAEYDGKEIKLPRGTLDSSIQLLEQNGAVVKLNDLRPITDHVNFTFRGTLTTLQEKAVNEIAKHDYGVLVSPPGTGKTVMGCALIVARSVPTLILVHRKQLAEQWKERLLEFIDIDKKSIDIIGSGRNKTLGIIDIAMLQTVSRKEDIKELLGAYGQIIIDECHHIPAVSFEAVMKDVPARYITGLTATPYRKDGLQAILYMQCGPVRYEIEEMAYPALLKKVIVQETYFGIQNDSGKKPIYEIWDELVDDSKRLNMIASDVIFAINNNRFPLILSERKEHLYKLKETIESLLANSGIKAFLFEGDTGKKARTAALVEINEMLAKGEKPYILSTGSLIGEGFDMPQLDTLFLAMPLSFKGRVIQYAGRLHRPYKGKNEVIIYDYCDLSIGLTVSMFKKRLSAYRNMGYEVKTTGNPKIDKWILRL